MYEKFFKLNQSPFSLLPDPSFMYRSRHHEMALALLKYSLIGNHSFSVVTGEVGSGKTTLINHLLHEIDPRFTVGLINFTDQRVTHLWPWILQSFGILHTHKDSVTMYQDLVAFVSARQRRGRPAVLIVDEAQNLSAKALESLRMVSNVNATETLLRLILVGQPEFRETLKRKNFRQLNQRVSVYYRLEPLTASETRRYIDHRLEVAGGRPEIFTDDAVAVIWRKSGGIARIINTYCDFALIYGYASDKPVIDEEVVCQMLADRDELAVPVYGQGDGTRRVAGPREVGEPAN